MAGQEYGTASLGGNLSLPYLTEVLRYSAQPLSRFRDMCDVKEAIGKSKGDVFQWNIVANIATQGTVVAETATIPSTNFTLTKGSCTIYEFANSIPFTRKLRDLSEYELADIVRKTLANDMAKALDLYIFDNCVKTTPLIVQASDGTDTTLIEFMTDGTGDAALAATCWLNTNHITGIVDGMKERKIPTFDGENYVAIAHPSTLTRLRTQLLTADQYTTTGYAKRLSGEIGMYGGVRFVEQTNVGKLTPTNAGAGSWCAFFGGESIVEAISQPEQIIEKEVTDYGRSLGLAWYFVGGFTPVFTHNQDAGQADVRVVLWYPNASEASAASYTG